MICLLTMPIDEREEAKQFLNLSESRTLRELIARPSASRTISNPRMFIGKSRSRTWKKAEVRDVVTSGTTLIIWELYDSYDSKDDTFTRESVEMNNELFDIPQQRDALTKDCKGKAKVYYSSSS
ncbi:protein phosphatase 2C and cyclic nucleotide-binding/kinase domain-containing protein [Cucumis melo var. makuwa]|uniref:Protein phosphatase 2C and cyclic nucleotide-binding/kinase domain-containing protein n=1 Tax=Cucumis melo var. makuwa TaxID=1194695 RepID=A0A5A7UTA0_CUCMM|nr:protein phosphatase 2C and cyclic nucleotide-binding/kinase domain-containing protein [Cucumis melo var. makuwa]TYK30065.1 protein phosphatase 2C and cyclic nucleotide-binding/kinase domain-containing protein [Cucumis melo var. makuwa]